MQATDSNLCIGSRAYTLLINCPTITIAPATVPNPIQYIAYSQQITAGGGIGPYTYAVTAGALPGGLTLNTSTGLISGTPSASGSFNFTITGTDSNGCAASRAYSVSIPTTSAGGAPMLSGWALIALTGLLALFGFAVTRN